MDGVDSTAARSARPAAILKTGAPQDTATPYVTIANSMADASLGC